MTQERSLGTIYKRYAISLFLFFSLRKKHRETMGEHNLSLPIVFESCLVLQEQSFEGFFSLAIETILFYVSRC